MKLLGNNRLLFIDYVELILYYTKETFLNWGNPVSKSVRILLLIVGLILLLLAIAALAFVFWPDSFVRESIQLPASLFNFPGK